MVDFFGANLHPQWDFFFFYNINPQWDPLDELSGHLVHGL